MQTGWVRQPEGWYYAYPGGNQRTGWLQLGSKWYYLDGKNTEYPGLMVTGPKEEIKTVTRISFRRRRRSNADRLGLKLPEGWYYAHPGGNQAYGWLKTCIRTVLSGCRQCRISGTHGIFMYDDD